MTMGSPGKVVVLCILLSVCVEVATAATCDPTDNSALLYFCREFVYARKEFDTWIDGTDCCTWTGVTCDGNGHVTDLNIQNIDQNPPYPPNNSPYYMGTALTGLNYLQNLTMKNVAFNGEIPPSWGTMTTMSALSLESCNIVGGLPKELCQLIQLLTFDLFDNQLSGALPGCYSTPTTTFPNMKYFNISQNNLG